MQARILMAGALFSGAMMVPAPHAASVTARYKVAQRIFQEVDATALGGGKQGFVVKTTSYVQLTLTDTTGGRSVKVLVDSIHGDSLPPGAPADMLTKAAGVVVTGFVDGKGKLSNVKASSDAGGLQLTSLVQQLMPPISAPPQGRRCVDRHHRDGERSLGQHEHAHRHQLQGHRHRGARQRQGEQGRRGIQLVHRRHPGDAGRFGRHRRHRHRHVELPRSRPMAPARRHLELQEQPERHACGAGRHHCRWC